MSMSSGFLAGIGKTETDREAEDMAERRQKSDLSDSSPQFFKVYLPDQSTHRLQIPPAFVKYFTGVFPFKSTITSPEKRSWHVELKEVDGHVYFQEGWEQFGQDNSLEFGDFLIFDYGSDAQFYVQTYGKNGCQKEVSELSREINRDITHPRHNQTAEQKKSKRSMQGANGKEIAQKESCPRFSKEIQEGSRAHKENIFMSKFPFFEVVMNPSYVTRGYMNIPSSFHRYMEKGRHSLILVASDRSWPVKLINYGRIWRFIGGWSTFCRENKLKEGDACAFELIEKNEFVLKVSVFRCPD